MGKRSKVRSNPRLATEHPAGAPVYICGALVHNRLGMILYARPRYWMFHLRFAQEAAQELARLHETVLRLEPGPSAARVITDEDLLRDVFRAGNALVSNAVRAVQQLAEEIERHRQTTIQGQTVEERINEAAALFASEKFNTQPDYASLGEINRIRDALEHPRLANVIAQDPGGWDAVPIAWMLSNRSLDAWGRFERWFARLSSAWDHFLQATDKPGTVTVERGLESLLQVKKPPKI